MFSKFIQNYVLKLEFRRDPDQVSKLHIQLVPLIKNQLEVQWIEGTRYNIVAWSIKHAQTETVTDLPVTARATVDFTEKLQEAYNNGITMNESNDYKWCTTKEIEIRF